ncbi:Fe-S cluster assembly ATPase SufC [Candidatus Nomurabacteria bacterium]|uniref:Fe-S cluster assembly ATPase SufC n=1 Tax=candidate division WWE3 bacterium TaxID=2053526 RepID=A0A955E020_UNCKA|nr:Fe-S cluster assembly ATPase SufC [candidate division WWE3 bacterium]MCB9823375.1 Fe-S cluster assembly ATPase SufC [Candidatus Nomurabacteria bacterium]MCB9826732.1 Fe-S cluster assembly ATPase SufC [Candidatus Nomurabacteria bacterium]MCB9827657.1 Fe-S cluster assembly ATPase SufC [Candidatus Nomurabacteria bacterium]HXK52860.1 Fe-S cluster assembly ATPase SufC [bacterium]
MLLQINNLRVSIEDKEILKGITLKLGEGEVVALMGPNGSGKSTLAQTLMGNPAYTVTDGNALFDSQKLFSLEANERSNLGLFLSFQYPSEVTGVTISNFLRLIYNKKNNTKISPAKFRTILKEKLSILEMPEDFMSRYLNEGFSGGEKKRMEMLQMLVLEPKLAVLDETDSGLDIDALKIVAKAVSYLRQEKGMAVLIITHYTRVLQYLEPDKVVIMRKGIIVKEGDSSLAQELEDKGYAPFGE